MATQTGSIDLKAAGSFSVYASGEYATADSMSAVESTIKQHASEIALRVTKREFEALEIGGRNLGLKSATFGTASASNRVFGTYSTSATAARDDGLYEVTCSGNWQGIIIYPDQLGLSVGDTVTLSVGVRNDSTASKWIRFYAMCFKDGSRYQGELLGLESREGTGTYTSIAMYQTFPAGQDERVWVRITWLQAAQDFLDDGGTIAFTVQCASSDWSTGNVAMYAPKIEKGNKPTDWTPAPEDTDARVTAAESAITQNAENIELKVSKNGVISSINQSAESVTIDASRVNIAGATLFTSGRLSQSSLDSAYDASGAASTAQANAISSANSTTDTKLANYSTTTQMNTTISTAVDGIEVGGRNLLRDTASMSLCKGNGSTVSDGIAVIQGTTTGWNTLVTFPTIDFALIDGENIIFSFDYECDEDALVYVALQGCPVDVGAESSGRSRFVDVIFTLPAATEWARYNLKYAMSLDKLVSGSGDVVSFNIGMYCRTDVELSIRKLKLERGNKPTDWTPAPEDTDAAISAANSQEQLIYKTAADGTTSMDGTTSWITSTSDTQAAWTTKRPTYSQSYPVLFVATQRKTVGGTVTCTTPLIDDTTTVIDGGHIITGSVTANAINASSLNASGSLTVGALTSAAQASVLNENVQVGGRNLLLNSATLPLAGSSNWQTGTWRLAGSSNMARSMVSISDPPSNVSATKAFQCVGSQPWNDGSDIGIDGFPKVSGDYYVVSCWARVVGGGTGYAGFSCYSADYISGWDKVLSQYGYRCTTLDSSGAWTRCHCVIKATASTGNIYIGAHTMSSSDDTSGNSATIQICAPMIQHANKLSDWTPAPEDTDSAIATAKSEAISTAATDATTKANNAAKTATNYLTTITGTSGISVHDAGDTSNYANISSSGMDVVQGGTSVASFGSEARIGGTASKHVTTESDGIHFYDGSTEMGAIRPMTASDYPLTWSVTCDSGQWEDGVNGNAITFAHLTEHGGFTASTVGGYVYVSSQWYQLAVPMAAVRTVLMNAGVSVSSVESSSQYNLQLDASNLSDRECTVIVRSSTNTSSTYDLGWVLVKIRQVELGQDNLVLDANISTRNILAGTVEGDFLGGTVTADKFVSTAMAGMIQMFGGSTAPTGWLLCNGAAVSRTDYAALFAVIGTTYGTGDGSTTFNLPNLQGKFPLGSSSSYSLASTGGSKDAIVPYHNHSMTSVLTSASVSIASSKAATSSSGISDIMRDTNGIGTLTSTNYAGSSGNATGANMPPYVAVNYIICTGI